MLMSAGKIRAPLNAVSIVLLLLTFSDGAIVRRTDVGRAMMTGKWADIRKLKGPILRALANRAPLFHNGSAMILEEVVNFYDIRFAIGLTPQEKADLVAFLSAF